MALVITGGRGVLASALAPDIDFIPIDRAEGDLALSGEPLVRAALANDTVAHFAAVMDHTLAAARPTLAILCNVIEACEYIGTKRLIYASSLAAAPDENDLGYRTYYCATKQAGEAFVHAWTAGSPDRVGIALRFGAYWAAQPPSCRMTRDALIYWVRRAMAEGRPGFHVWNAHTA